VSYRPRFEILEDRWLPSTLTVTTANDQGLGSLRYAIALAAPGDTIDFAPTLAGQTIILTSGQLAIASDLTIVGLGASQLTISGNDTNAIFDILAPATVNISNLTVSSGAASTGGGLFMQAGSSVTLTQCIFSNNLATNGSGGAISGVGSANPGALTIDECTFVSNTATQSGGAIDLSGVNLTILSSTFVDNLADGLGDSGGGNGGGAIFLGAGLATILDCTFANNGAPFGSGGAISNSSGASYTIESCTFAYNTSGASGGAIFSGPVTMSLVNTLVADNNSPNGPDIFGPIFSQGNNLFGDTNGLSGIARSDLQNVNPLLGKLQDNGGPTETIALDAGSPALDAGNPAPAPSVDQRGVARGLLVNIGAYQATPSALVFSTGKVNGSVVAGVVQQVKVTAEDVDGQLAPAYTGTIHFQSTDPQAVLPADYTFTLADGGSPTFNITPKTAGGQSITVGDTSSALTPAQASGTVDPAAASQLKILGPSGVTEGAAVDVTVTALDPFGNVASGYLGTVSFTSSDGEAVLPGNYTFLAADLGMHTFVGGLMLSTKGTQTVAVADAAVASITGSTVLVVADVAPVVVAAGPGLISLQTTYTGSGSFSDPGREIWAATVDYGDGSGAQPLALKANDSFFLAHVYGQEGTYTVTITVVGSNGDPGTDVLTVNVLPGSTAQETEEVVAPGQTADASVTAAMATLVRSSNDQGPATLILANLGVTTVAGVAPGSKSSTTVILATFDIRLVLGGSGDWITVTFSYPSAHGIIPVLEYFDPQDHELDPVHGSLDRANSLVVNSADRTITFILDGTSVPAITGLDGTVFTISVPSTIESSTQIAPPVAMNSVSATGATSDSPASQALVVTTSFQRTSQLTLALSASQGVNAPSEGSGTTEDSNRKESEGAAWLRMLLELLESDPRFLMMFSSDAAMPASMPVHSQDQAYPSAPREPARTGVGEHLKSEPAKAPSPSVGTQSRTDNKDAYFAAFTAAEWDLPAPAYDRADKTDADKSCYDPSWAVAAVLAGLVQHGPRPVSAKRPLRLRA